MYICAKGEGGLDMYIQTWHNEFELVLRGLNGGRVMPGRDLARPRSRSGPGSQNEFELVLPGLNGGRVMPGCGRLRLDPGSGVLMM